jgi:hypothetical protein
MIKNKSLRFLCLLIFSVTFKAQAARIIEPPSMFFHTVHGGQVGAATCVTADMHNSAAYFGTSGVDQGIHSISVSLKNISNIAQTVTIELLPGTYVSSSNSNGAASSIPHNPGPSQTLRSAVTVYGPRALQPYESSVASITYACSSRSCYLPRTTPSAGCTLGTPQVCLGISSQTTLKITVQEDRGAILANITTSAHRACGYKDHFMTPPPSFTVNGGKAF